MRQHMAHRSQCQPRAANGTAVQRDTLPDNPRRVLPPILQSQGAFLRHGRVLALPLRHWPLLAAKAASGAGVILACSGCTSTAADAARRDL